MEMVIGERTHNIAVYLNVGNITSFYVAYIFAVMIHLYNINLIKYLFKLVLLSQ